MPKAKFTPLAQQGTRLLLLSLDFTEGGSCAPCGAFSRGGPQRGFSGCAFQITFSFGGLASWDRERSEAPKRKKLAGPSGGASPTTAQAQRGPGQGDKNEISRELEHQQRKHVQRLALEVQQLARTEERVKSSLQWKLNRASRLWQMVNNKRKRRNRKGRLLPLVIVN